jgi:hypothetical protein
MIRRSWLRTASRWLVPKSSTSSIRCGKFELEVRPRFSESAQRLRLALSPDVEVLLVQLLDPGSHARRFLELFRDYHIGALHRKAPGKGLYT